MQQARILLLAALVAYFALQFWPDGAATPSHAKTQSPPPTAAVPPCTGHIREATASTGELRLKVDGAAEVIRVSYDGGMLLRPTEEVCSAGFCRVFTPSPPKLVQLDRCPAISLPWPQ